METPKTRKWEELTIQERAGWEKKADEVNKANLGPLFKYCAELFKAGILIIKDGKVMLSGLYAYKILQQTGLRPQLLLEILNKNIKELIPQSYVKG